MTDLVRNIVGMTDLGGGKVSVKCVDEHLRYVHFTINRRDSTTEAASAIMHRVLDYRAGREEWKRNGSAV